MTQAVNLITGTAASVKSDASFLKLDQSQLVIEEFASIMNQNTQNFFGADVSYQKRSDDMVDGIFAVSDNAGSVQKDYAKLNQGNRTITEAKQETADSSSYAEKVTELAGQVEEAVQETMQVSGEEIENAMEALGLTLMDLLNPQNLVQLLQKLTGSDDVSALLTSESFQVTMQEVTGLIAQFQQDNGLSAEAFTSLLAQLSEEIDRLQETVQENLNPAGAEQPELTGQMMQEEAVEGEAPETAVQTPQDGQQSAVMSAGQPAEAVQAGETVSGQTEEAPQEQIPVQAEQRTSEQSAQPDSGEADTSAQDGRETKNFAQNMEEQTVGAAGHANVFQNTVAAVNEQAAMPQEIPQVMSYVDVQQLMDQMEGLARAFASAEGTTLEMQLNPESLGRLFLTVTEKQGAVTAQIAASNEQVKEALQTQMVELRSTLQAQGLKVEAVEVTVATHEFEQNLDGNSSANAQMQEQEGRQAAGQQNGRRNLNRSSLDELSGLMSEEETLVAQMMRDNGGTVDYTA